MFSKAKGKDEGTTLKAADHADPHTARMAGKARPVQRSTGVPSIISSDVVINGSLQAGGEVQFDGEIDGNLEAKGVVIGEGARVAGEVAAEKVRICGTVEGTVRGVQVELAATAQVKGDIIHASLSIENGARFEGNCRHADDPLSKGKSSPAPNKPRPIPAPPKSDAAAQHIETSHSAAPTVDAEIIEEPVDGANRKLMPVRNEPAPDRTFVSKPTVDNLR